MKKTFTNLRTLLVALLAVAATGSAWSAESTTIKGTDTFTANTNGTTFNNDYTDKSSATKTAIGVLGNGGSGNRYATLTFGTAVSASYVDLTLSIVLQSGNNNGSESYFKVVDGSNAELFALRMTGNNTTSVKLTYEGNSDGTEVMTASKAVDSAIGNGSSSYGLTPWTAVSAYFNFEDHNGTVTIGGNVYNIDLPETSTSIKGFQMQGGRGYGASLVATDYATATASAPAGAVTVKYVDSEDNEIADATLPSVSGMVSGDELTIRSPKYIANGGNLYIIGSDATATNPTTKTTVTLSGAAQEKKILYSVAQTGVFYVYDKDGGYTTRQDYESNGSAQTHEATVTVPVTGKYIVTANCYGSASNRTATISVGDTEIVGATMIGIYAPGTNLVSSEIILNANDVITVTTSSSKDGIDYIILQKTGDATLSATIGTAGFATLYTDFALDFSGVAGLEAYTATFDGSTVTLTQVDDVPAGTGVVLKGAADTYSIPVAASSSTAKGDLKGSTTESTTCDGSQYVLVKNGDKAQFAPATSGTIAAGKAYLVAVGAARTLNVVFAGETTGIKAVEAAEAQDAIYNLAGQRVEKAQKGLYIVNGKKVIK